MKITWNRTPKRRERFEGIYISETGVAYRDPVALMQSPKAQHQLKLIHELRVRLGL